MKIPGTIFANLKPDAEGWVELPYFDKYAFQTLEIIAINENSVVSLILPIENHEL